MASKKLDYSVFDGFNFERKPVGVQFSLKKPERIEPLEQGLALCELFKEAQTSEPFYAVPEKIECGAHLLGMKEFPPLMNSGQLGPMYAMFKNPGANRRIYEYMPQLSKDSVKYVSFASLDRLTFEPDVLIFTTTVSQAEVILRASSFANGKMWSSKGTTCLACAWIYVYPFLTGELNFTISGLGFSMKARGILPEGLMIISVPFDLIAPLIANLKEMEWNPDWFNLGREGFIEKAKTSSKELADEYGL